MKLREWLENKDLSEKEQKRVSKMLDIDILKEFFLGDEKNWISWQEFGTHKNVMNWVILESGYCVGFNESPSRGFSFPVKKSPNWIWLQYIK